MESPVARIVLREDKKWEQVVFAEVLVPDVVNNFGDIYTEEAIAEFAYEFARQGYGLDINHDNENIDGTGAYVVESFLVRDGDPDFIKGSWVIGVKILDAEVWASILGGEINGFSYEALVTMVPVSFIGTSGRQITGTTSADAYDGHSHTFVVFVDALNNPLSGATSENNDHSHTIVSHTTTEVVNGHNHRYQVVPIDHEE